MAWYENRPDRLAIEKRLLKQRYPEVKLVKKGGLLRVILSIRCKRTIYGCELVYPSRFPFASMKALVRSPRIKSDWHQYRDGSLCLHHDGDVGPQTTAVVYIKWLEGWIKRYEESLTTGQWRN